MQGGVKEKKAMTPHDSISTTRNRLFRGPIEQGTAFMEMTGLAGGGAATLAPGRRRDTALAPRTERVRVVVIGAGQAGLAVGYHLARRSIPFVILDANARVGDQ